MVIPSDVSKKCSRIFNDPNSWYYGDCTSVVAAFRRGWVTNQSEEDWQGSVDDAGKTLKVFGWSRYFPDENYISGTGSEPEITPTTSALTHVFISQEYVNSQKLPVIIEKTDEHLYFKYKDKVETDVRARYSDKY